MVLGEDGFGGWGFIYLISFALGFSSAAEGIGHGVGVGRVMRRAEGRAGRERRSYPWELEILRRDGYAHPLTGGHLLTESLRFIKGTLIFALKSWGFFFAFTLKR